MVMAQYERDNRKFMMYVNNNYTNNTNNNLSTIYPPRVFTFIPADSDRSLQREPQVGPESVPTP